MRAPAIPSEPIVPTVGRYLWTCRTGFEPHLFEELAWKKASPKLLWSGLVESAPLRESEPRPAFARAGLLIQAIAEGDLPFTVGSTVQTDSPAVQLHIWAPDTDAGNALAQEVRAVQEALKSLFGERVVDSFQAAKDRNGRIVQVCLLSASLAAVGVQHPSDVLSPAPGGRHRMWRESSTSRAASKLEEALESLPVAPGKGELCVDLGAAPGGWTERLLARGARVIAVDPANLSPALMGHGKLRHVKDSAFSFAPTEFGAGEPADWLFCDMAWRPLEVAALLAKWGRNGWANQLVANIKLPMKDKNEILHRVRFILEQHGRWTQLRIRQLYHDRDEVTVTAVRRA